MNIAAAFPALDPARVPSPGRIVHYYVPGISGAFPAVITATLACGHVRLAPFFPSQASAFYPGPGTAPTPYSPFPKAGYWTWPAPTKETHRA